MLFRSKSSFISLQLLSTDGFEHRLNTLEESYELAQKQIGMALAIAEQLKTSDLPTQVLSLHTEMKARLAEMQQATVSADQLTQLQVMLKGKSEEFEAVRLQVEGLAGLSTELAQSVEGLTGSLAERAGLLGTLSATMEGQASDLLGVKEQLSANKAQLEASTAEITSVRYVVYWELERGLKCLVLLYLPLYWLVSLCMHTCVSEN